MGEIGSVTVKLGYVDQSRDAWIEQDRLGEISDGLDVVTWARGSALTSLCRCVQLQGC